MTTKQFARKGWRRLSKRKRKVWFAKVYLESWAEKADGVRWPFVNGIDGAGAGRAGRAGLGGLLAVKRCLSGRRFGAGETERITN